MPVKLSDVKGLMLDYISPEVKVKAVENSDYVRYGYNQALSLQSEVCIGINREKLAVEIYYSMRPNRNEPFEKIKGTEVEKYCYEMADSIIAAESTLLEVKP